MAVVRSLVRSLVMLLAAVVVLFFAETVPGGRYKVKGRLVDANGEPIPDAPESEAETEPDPNANAGQVPPTGTGTTSKKA